MPPGFKLYASTDTCQVQMIGHAKKPIYAIQFHPEAWDEAHPDGQRFLENFFRHAVSLEQAVSMPFS
ncbi:MAG: glutamine amidotransferase-related protein [Anaerolineales bacterium]